VFGWVVWLRVLLGGVAVCFVGWCGCVFCWVVWLCVLLVCVCGCVCVCVCGALFGIILIPKISPERRFGCTNSLPLLKMKGTASRLSRLIPVERAAVMTTLRVGYTGFEYLQVQEDIFVSHNIQTDCWSRPVSCAGSAVSDTAGM
jgi:hypothetical protein